MPALATSTAAAAAAQLQLDDAPACRGGGVPPRLRRHLGPHEVWWVPGERFHHIEAAPLRFDHIAAHAVFGTSRAAIAAGAERPCRRCANLLGRAPVEPRA